MTEQDRKRMIDRHVSKGFAAAEAPALLDELLSSHEGDNLAYALSYWGFATERTAAAFAASH